MLNQMSLWDTHSVTSLPVSEGGVTLSDSPDGPTTDQSGQEVAPANLSARQAKAQGLMTIAPLDVTEDETRACFRSLGVLRDRLAAEHPRLNLPVLSMGMSGDYPLAIAEGATRIRVGTALFGVRTGIAR